MTNPFVKALAPLAIAQQQEAATKAANLRKSAAISSRKPGTGPRIAR